MNPELNCEYPEPDEANLIEEMIKVAVERMKLQPGRIRRAQHAKATGCVRGAFTIRDDVADDLRHGGVHQPNQSFQAIVRFSNSSEMMASEHVSLFPPKPDEPELSWAAAFRDPLEK